MAISRLSGFINPWNIGRNIRAGFSYLAGVPAAIASLGAHLASSEKFSINLPIECSREEIRLPKIIWKNNSCFLSSAMWSFFLNEPIVLNTLSASIERRMAVEDLFPKIIPRILDSNLSDQKRAALLEVGHQLTTRGNLPELCKQLKILVKGGYPDGVNDHAVNELISLLELQILIDECQAGQPVDGNRINSLRETLKRVNSNFLDMGNRTGDASEVINILADLIFEGSPIEQNHTKILLCIGKNSLSPIPQWDEQVNPLTGIITDGKGTEKTPSTGEIKSIETNWGRFELELTPNASVKHLLENRFFPPVPYERKHLADNYKLEPFEIHETNQLKRPPELLVLTMGRLEKPDIKIDVEENLELDPHFFKNGEAGRYELTGISKHLGSFAHYISLVKRPNGSILLCDDLRGKCDPCSHDDFMQAAQTGYVLIYRKI